MSSLTESDEKYEISNPLISDNCIHHHFDAYVVPLNDSITNSFGSMFKDIAVKNQLIDSNINNYSHIIANIIAFQCPRLDPIVVYQPYEGSNDFKYIKDKVFNQNEDQQLVMFRYQSTNNDETGMNFLDFYNIIQTVRESNDPNIKKAAGLAMEMKWGDTEWRANTAQEMINLIEFDDINAVKKQNQHKKIPLFVHHFYPISINILIQILENLNISLVIAKCIAQYVFVDDKKYLFYQSWYLQRNVEKLNLKRVTFWDNILFNSKQYELKQLTHSNKSWIPSEILMKYSINDIMSALSSNNILNVFRPFIWYILLYHVFPCHKPFECDAEFIKKCFDRETLSFAAVNFDKNSISENEINDFNFMCVLYAFGGYILDSQCALNRILTMKENNPFSLYFGNSWAFTKKLTNTINKTHPIVDPETYKIIETIFNENEQVFEDFNMWQMFYNANQYDVSVKCYLADNILYGGFNAMSILFAAFVKINADRLIKLFNATDALYDLKQQTETMYAFNDVTSMAKIYVNMIKIYEDAQKEEHDDEDNDIAI
eukprot:369270_1